MYKGSTREEFIWSLDFEKHNIKYEEEDHNELITDTAKVKNGLNFKRVG